MRISMHKGDIRYVRFQIRDLHGKIANIDFTEIYFTVKKCFKNHLFAMQKKLSAGEIIRRDKGDYQFVIKPEDTALMATGDYVFDIQVDYKVENTNILKETFVGDFALKPEVTLPENE